MNKKIYAVALAFFALLLILGATSEAQTTNICIRGFNYWFLSGPIPLGATCYEGSSFFFTPCTIPNASCAPKDSKDEVCLACQLAAAMAGLPINLATGNTYIQQSDLRIPGLGGGLSLVRVWNSKWPASQITFQIGLFGPNWRSTYEERVFLGVDDYIKYSRADGSFWSFGYNGATWNVAAPSNVAADLAAGSTYWTLTFQNGEKRHFDNTTGYLTAIIDRNGNTTQLTYDSYGRLATVTDAASRYLTFSYGSTSSHLVTGVTASVGPSLSYSYDTSGRLTQITKPDSTTVSFSYNSSSQITSVTDSSGHTLESHTYDSNGRGLTSSRASGVEAISVTYP